MDISLRLLITKGTFWVSLALFAWVAARSSVYLITSAPELPEVRHPQVEVVEPRGDLVHQIVAANLFGVMAPEADSTLVHVRPGASVEGLALHGILSNPEGGGYAVISGGEAADVPKLYSLGDKLPGGGVLRKIRVDHVIVDIGRNLENLYLRAPDAGRAASVARPISRRSTRAASARDAGLVEFQRKLRNDPASLSRQFVARPFRRNGSQIGYFVRAMGDKRLMRSLGLRNGDVVTQVNGIELDSNAQIMRLYQELLEAKSVVAKVIRGGKTIELRKMIR